MTPLPDRSRPFREGDVYRRLAVMVDQGEQGVLATVIGTRQSAPRHAGSKMIVHADGTVTGSVGGGAAEALVVARAADVLADGVCRTVPIDLQGGEGICGGTMEVFLEPVLRAVPFWVIGAGHVGQAVVALGATLGFRFTVVDDRPDLLAACAALGARTVLAAPADLAAELTVPRLGGLLVCSRDHDLDAGYLRAVLQAERSAGRVFAFCGVLGSRRKAARLRQRIGAEADLAPRMAAVRSPVGLALGAETPAEIALAVLSEALAVIRGVAPVALVDGGCGLPLLGLGEP